MKLNIIGEIDQAKSRLINKVKAEAHKLIWTPGDKENNSQNLTINSKNTNINIPFDTSSGCEHIIDKKFFYDYVWNQQEHKDYISQTGGCS